MGVDKLCHLLPQKANHDNEKTTMDEDVYPIQNVGVFPSQSS